MDVPRAVNLFGKWAVAIFHILAGGAGAFADAVLTWMCLAMGGSVGEASLAFAFAVGGVLYAAVGIYLLLPNRRGWRSAIVLQTVAIALAAIYLGIFLLMSVGQLKLDPHDEEIVMFVLLPAAVLGLAIVELLFFWWKWKALGE